MSTAIHMHEVAIEMACAAPAEAHSRMAAATTKGDLS